MSKSVEFRINLLKIKRILKQTWGNSLLKCMREIKLWLKHLELDQKLSIYSNAKNIEFKLLQAFRNKKAEVRNSYEVLAIKITCVVIV